MFPFRSALNASTLFAFKLDVKQQISIAAKAGFAGIELWVGDIEDYLGKGGTVQEIKSHLHDSGIALVNAIAFLKWSDIDEVTREQAFAQAKIEMTLLAELGCHAVAAPPLGDVEAVSLDDMAENFTRLVELGRRIGIEPYLEFWGRAKQLSLLSEAIYIIKASGVSNAKILLDPFHMYTGGSDLNDMKELKGNNIGIFHVNDYPMEPSKELIGDKDRVFPGEGIAPTRELAQYLFRSGYQGYLSLELFIDNYGELSALEVAKKGFQAIVNAYSIEE